MNGQIPLLGGKRFGARLFQIILMMKKWLVHEIMHIYYGVKIYVTLILLFMLMK
jgi:hypothetical protein